MNSEQVQNFLATKIKGENKYVKIDFKGRESLYGIFLTDGNDFRDMMSKNFWRVVSRRHFDEYNKSRNPNLARIFNGTAFTKLSLLADEF